MSKTNIPGLAAKHLIITPQCIQNKGVGGALCEAVNDLEKATLEMIQTGANRGSNFHLVLTVERPPKGKAGKELNALLAETNKTVN